MPKKSVRYRPGWHKILGWALVGVGVFVAVINDLALISVPTPMPGGHSEFYLVAGIALAAWGGWWLATFDRPTNVAR